MQGKRSDRVGQVLQQELSRLVLDGVKDPRLGFVTVTHVKLTPDLKSAVVFFSVMGDEKQKKNSLGALRRATGFLQREIGNNLKLRYTPRLQFEIDDTFEKRMEVDRTLHQLKAEEESHESE